MPSGTFIPWRELPYPSYFCAVRPHRRLASQGAGSSRIQQPFHEIGQIFTGADEMGFDMSVFRMDPPVYEEILTVRAERQRLVSDSLATATAGLLAEERQDPWGRRLASQRR